jgi:hypothetical protein
LFVKKGNTIYEKTGFIVINDDLNFFIPCELHKRIDRDSLANYFVSKYLSKNAYIIFDDDMPTLYYMTKLNVKTEPKTRIKFYHGNVTTTDSIYFCPVVVEFFSRQYDSKDREYFHQKWIYKNDTINIYYTNEIPYILGIRDYTEGNSD